jgi:hypothetical protein
VRVDDMKNPLHFTSGDYGYYGDFWDKDDIWWDGLGEEPPAYEIKEAREEWGRDGWDEARKHAS